jgi:alpha/beta superfamily hydrolase
MLEKIQNPGEHPLLLKGPAGIIEAVLTIPNNANERFFALLGHPHSLQGGSMSNKVVTTLARSCKELGLASLRFNFRGVGNSEGIYDAGVGESEDMLFLANSLRQEKPDLEFIFAGFSFGSYVAYRAAAQSSHRLLLTIAPAVNHCNYSEFKPQPQPWVVLQGEEDEVVTPALVYDFAQQSVPPLPLIRFPHTGHFFHGKLLELKANLMDVISHRVEL